MLWWTLLACNPPPTPAETADFDAARPWFPCSDTPLDGAVEVVALENAHHRFLGENTQTLTNPVAFPEGEWAQVGLRLELTCPDSGPCDSWDRLASLRLLDAEGEPSIELLRYITPYKRQLCSTVDVTDLASELRGTRTLESYVETWVGDGHPDGEGWNVTATFIFSAGEAATTEVIPVWPRKRVVLGDPARTVADQLPPTTVELPAGAKRVRAQLVTTGHGFDYSENCAEFCRMENVLQVGDSVTRSDPWRGNCDANPIDDQLGTWELDRNGWCPGAVARGRTFDLTDQLQMGSTVPVALDIERLGAPYVEQSGNPEAPYTEVSLHLLVDF